MINPVLEAIKLTMYTNLKAVSRLVRYFKGWAVFGERYFLTAFLITKTHFPLDEAGCANNDKSSRTYEPTSEKRN